MKQAIKMLKTGRMDVMVIPDLRLSKENFVELFGEGPLNININVIGQIEIFHFIHERHSKLVPEFTLKLQQKINKNGIPPQIL